MRSRYHACAARVADNQGGTGMKIEITYCVQ
jgi:hypothetical protein